MGQISGIDPLLIGLVMMGLFLFGVGFNWLIATLGDLAEGYTSILVVGGVCATLLGLAVLDTRAALLAVILFIASGLPMIIGSIWRTIKVRKAAIEAAKREIEKREGDSDDHAA